MHRVTLRIDFAPEWEEKTLKDVCSLISRGSAPTYMEESTVFAIGQRCVRETGFQASEARPHDSRRLSGQLMPRHGDVLLNSTGTGTIGRSCVFDANGDFIVDGHVTVLRPQSTHLDGRWLNAVLQLPEGQVYLETQCYSGSTNQVELSRARLESTALHLPHISEQRRIAEILDTVDEAIRATGRLIEKLKAIKIGLLHDLLTRGIDENGRLRDPIAHPEEFRVSVLGLIPRDWKVQRLADISNTFAGGTPSRAGRAFFGGGIPWVKSAEVNAPTIFTTEETLSKRGLAASSAEWVRAATLVIAMYGATAGQVAWLAIDATTNQAVLAAPVKNPSTVSRWLYWALVHKTPRLIAAVQGSGQPNLSKGIVDSLQLARPGSTHEQSLIAAILDNMDQRLDAEESALGKLRSLKKGLMHDLLTGKVRVPIDEEDDDE
jgi:type I restriction enzyme S subunit